MSRHRSIEIDVANCFILSLEGSIDDSKVGKVEKKEAFVISMIISRTMAARFGSIFFTASFDCLRRRRAVVRRCFAANRGRLLLPFVSNFRENPRIGGKRKMSMENAG